MINASMIQYRKASNIYHHSDESQGEIVMTTLNLCLLLFFSYIFVLDNFIMGDIT